VVEPSDDLSPLGQANQARPELRRALELDPRNLLTRLTRVAEVLVLCLTGNRDQEVERGRALAELFRLLDCLVPIRDRSLLSGRSENGRVCHGKGSSARRYVSLLARSLACESTGDMDYACELVDRALDERDPQALTFLRYRRLELQSDPRYQALLRKMNIALSLRGLLLADVEHYVEALADA
jgi:tetratricopeptide (TPR) repeat protein